MKERMGGGWTAITSLAVKVQEWPTPQAHDLHGPKTAEQIETARRKSGAAVRNLNESAELWQTPATDSFRSRGGDRKDEQSRFWASPQARDTRSGETIEDYETIVIVHEMRIGSKAVRGELSRVRKRLVRAIRAARKLPGNDRTQPKRRTKAVSPTKEKKKRVV